MQLKSMHNALLGVIKRKVAQEYLEIIDDINIVLTYLMKKALLLNN